MKIPHAIAKRLLHWTAPNPSRDLLLRAALMPDLENARSALDRWLTKHDLDDMTFADHRLLAAITERLGPYIKDRAEFPRLKGLQRQLWTQSRIRLNADLPMLKTLANAGINLMLLKGAARLAINSAAQRQRSQQDVDILVRQDQMRLAAQLLSDNGWRTARGDSALAAIARAETTRAINFQHLPFGDIDLHRRAYHGDQNHSSRDYDLWQNAKTADFFGLKVLVPCPAERLTMMLAHGARSPEAHSDWLIDAAELIKSQDVNWQQVCSIIHDRNMVHQAASGLSYLQSIMTEDFTSEATHLLAKLSIPATASTLGNILIGREESRTPALLKPIRRACVAYIRKKHSAPDDAFVTPLVITLSKATKTRANQSASTTHKIDVLPPLLKGEQLFSFEAEISFAHPGIRRRVEIELNSKEQNLARFRILVWQREGTLCKATLRAKIHLAESLSRVTLEARRGIIHFNIQDDAKRAKYAEVPFTIHKANWRRLSGRRAYFSNTVIFKQFRSFK